MDETVELLDRWYAGERAALERLLEQELDWMHRKVRAELPAALRPKVDSLDVVQAGALRMLQYGPRFRPANRQQFRSLLARMLVNMIRDRHAARGEERLASRDQSGVRDPRRDVTQPDQAAERGELREWILLALELLEPDDRQVIRLCQLEQLPFAEVAARMQLASPDAARMRFNRALPRLTQVLVALRGAARGG